MSRSLCKVKPSSLNNRSNGTEHWDGEMGPNERRMRCSQDSGERDVFTSLEIYGTAKATENKVYLECHAVKDGISAASNKTNILANLNVHSYYTVNNDIYFQCPICEQKSNYKDMCVHIKTHTFSRPFSCIKCQIVYRQKYLLLKHLIGHNQLKPFVCKICSRTLKCKDGIIEHLRKAHNFHYRCAYCAMEFLDIKNIKLHINNHVIHTTLSETNNKTPDDRLNSSWHNKTICVDVKDQETDDLLEQEKTVALQNQQYLEEESCVSDEFHNVGAIIPINRNSLGKFICCICGKALKDDGDLRAHLTLHPTDDNQVSVKIHSRTQDDGYQSSTWNQNLETTQKTTSLLNEGEKYCESTKLTHKQEVNINALSLSREEKTNNSVNIYCGENVTYENQTGIKENKRNKHELVQADPHYLATLYTDRFYTLVNTELLECPFCKIKMTWDEMKKHILNHKFGIPPSCSTCKVDTRCISRWQRHLMTHFPCRPFACLMCNETFKNKDKVMSHLKCIHNISYTCPFCGRHFLMYSQIKRHVHSHIKEAKGSRIDAVQSVTQIIPQVSPCTDILEQRVEDSKTSNAKEIPHAENVQGEAKHTLIELSPCDKEIHFHESMSLWREQIETIASRTCEVNQKDSDESLYVDVQNMPYNSSYSIQSQYDQGYLKSLSLWIEKETKSSNIQESILNSNSLITSEARYVSDRWILEGDDIQFKMALRKEKLAVEEWMSMTRF